MALEGRRVLYISYNGMLDPLGQSQVLPYLRELTKKGVLFNLLSFERPGAFEAEGIKRCEELRDQLARQNIEWHRLRYHQKPSVPATIYDVMSGFRYAAKVVRRRKIEMIHARNHIPATIGLALKKRFGLKLIFDVRGLMAEEYVDAQHWIEGSIPHRLTKRMEDRALAAADGVVTLTDRIWPIIKEWKSLRGRDVFHEVVPCCTDLELFKFRAEDRDRRRKEMGVGDRFILVYSGSIDGWYLTEAMADFFVEFLKRKPDAHFLWLTTGRNERIRSLMQDRDIAPMNFTVIGAEPRDVPSYLSAADAGLALIKPCFSKLASSPTKYAEYLACGLPLIINAHIGDSDSLVTVEKVGLLISDLSEPGYAMAAAAIDSLMLDVEETGKRSRAVAERLFDVRGPGVERYARLYERIMVG